MIVVSDTSPLNYLILIDTVEILPRIFNRLAVPPAVIEELKHGGSPGSVRQWATSPPNWLMIQEPIGVERIAGLGAGESAAITLAEEQRAVAVLIDERDGRRVARARGLQVVGTLGLLGRAADLGLIDLDQSIERLKATNFRVQVAILDEMLRRHRSRSPGHEQGGESGPPFGS